MSPSLQERLNKVAKRAEEAYRKHMAELEELYRKHQQDILSRLSKIKNSV